MKWNCISTFVSVTMERLVGTGDWSRTSQIRVSRGITKPLHLVLSNILKSCEIQDRGVGWDAMKPLYWISVNSKDSGRLRLTLTGRMKWNETKWMNECGEMVEWNMGRGKTGETPRKTYPDTVSSTRKPTCCDRDAKSGPKQGEADV